MKLKKNLRVSVEFGTIPHKRNLERKQPRAAVSNNNVIRQYSNSYDFRFSNEYFSQIPESPGVYWFLDSRRNILYLDSAPNLRSRLLKYKRSQTDPSTDSPLPLVLKNVRQIQWKPTSSLSRAQRLKTSLNKSFQPLFQSSHSEGLLLEVGVTRILIGISDKSPSFNYQLKIGPLDFKSSPRKWMGSLSRWIWILHNNFETTKIPPRLLKKSSHLFYEIPTVEPWQLQTSFQNSLERFLLGYSDLFLEFGEQKISEYMRTHFLDRFYQQVFESDKALLSGLFEELVTFRKIDGTVLASNQRENQLVNS